MSSNDLYNQSKISFDSYFLDYKICCYLLLWIMSNYKSRGYNEIARLTCNSLAHFPLIFKSQGKFLYPKRQKLIFKYEYEFYLPISYIYIFLITSLDFYEIKIEEC